MHLTTCDHIRSRYAASELRRHVDPPQFTPLDRLTAASHAVSQPSVQLGGTTRGTTLVGSSLQSANLEFFGGNRSHIFDPMSSSHLALRHPLCRASSREPSLCSSQTQVFAFSPEII